MADVGSLAAADVARELGIPVVFTVAPDPHAVIQSLDRSGALTRANFGEIDMREHFWFRARLVQSLAANAAHTVLFPRPSCSTTCVNSSASTSRRTPSGTRSSPRASTSRSSTAPSSAAAAPREATAPPEAIAELRALLEELPAERRGLPLLVSVGRLHRVKGMATLVEAWATGPLRRPRQPADHRR